MTRNKSLTILSILITLVSILALPSCGGKKKKPNILLITIDTLRRDHVGVYGYHRKTSPFIDKLAREGIIFKNAVTPVPQTAPSHASMLTSLHPQVHNLTMNGGQLRKRQQTVAEVLKKDGYYTIGAVAVGVISGRHRFSKGFDSFSDEWEREKHLPGKEPFHHRTAASVNKSVFKQIDQYLAGHRDKPLFIWVHYFDPHSPYYEHESISFETPLPTRYKKPHIREAVEKYDKEIRFTDRHFEALYRRLEEADLTGTMVTCITADHGEQFGEHGFTFGHADFYSENTFVPLIFHGYGVPRGRVKERVVSTMDIGATLLGRAGAAFGFTTEGLDLLTLLEKRGALPKRKFLLVGTPNFARSLQLLDYPFSFILNFDYHYKHWYISGQRHIPEDLFKPVNRDLIKKKGKELMVPVPHSLQKGRHFAVLRMDVEQNKGLAAYIKVRPFLFTTKKKIPGDFKQVDIIYPVTIRDSVAVMLHPRPETKLDNLRYAFITANSLPPHNSRLVEIKNKIYTRLFTARKKKRSNEIYNLSTDTPMKNNLIEEQKLKPVIVASKKLIYKIFEYYLKKKEQFLRGKTGKENLSPEDIKMLKSLGYL